MNRTKLLRKLWIKKLPLALLVIFLVALLTTTVKWDYITAPDLTQEFAQINSQTTGQDSCQRAIKRYQRAVKALKIIGNPVKKTNLTRSIRIQGRWVSIQELIEDMKNACGGLVTVTDEGDVLRITFPPGSEFAG